MQQRPNRRPATRVRLPWPTPPPSRSTLRSTCSTGSAGLRAVRRRACRSRSRAAWTHWVAERDRLFREHPQTPLDRRRAAASTVSTTSATTRRCACSGRSRPLTAISSSCRRAARRRSASTVSAASLHARRQRAAREPVLARRVRRRALPAARRRDERGRDLRRRPLPARHGEGLRPRLDRGRPGARLQLRLQPVLQLRPALGLPARAAREPPRDLRAGRRAAHRSERGLTPSVTGRSRYRPQRRAREQLHRRQAGGVRRAARAGRSRPLQRAGVPACRRADRGNAGAGRDARPGRAGPRAARHRRRASRRALRELVETGEIAELAELRRTTPPSWPRFGRLLGFGASSARRDRRRARHPTVDELRAAAGGGPAARGPRHRAEDGGEDRRGARAGRPCPATRTAPPARARADASRSPTALGGIAGRGRAALESTPRPSSRSSSHRTTRPRCARASPRCRRSSRSLDADIGVTRRRRPGRARRRAARELGTALVRATGPPEYVAALGRFPTRRTRQTSTRCSGSPYLPPSSASAGSSRRARRRSSSSARSAATCTATRSGRTEGDACSRWARRRAARGYEYLAICDHTPNVTVVPGLDADALRRQAEEIAAANERARAVPRSCAASSATSAPTAASTSRTTCSPSSTGCSSRCIAGQRAPRARADRAGHRGDAPPGGALPQPSDRPPDRPPARERARPRADDRGRARDGRRARGQRAAQPARPEGEHVRPRSTPASRIVCSTDAHSVRGLDNMELAVHTARRGRAGVADVLNTRPLEALLR